MSVVIAEKVDRFWCLQQTDILSACSSNQRQSHGCSANNENKYRIQNDQRNQKVWAAQVSTTLNISFLMNLEKKCKSFELFQIKDTLTVSGLIVFELFEFLNFSESLWRIQSSDCLLRAWLCLKLNIFQQGNLVKVRSKDRDWKCTTHTHTHKRKSF